MFLAQRLERRRYARHRRVIFFRVTLGGKNGETPVWERYREGRWWPTLRRNGLIVLSAEKRAERKDYLPGVATLPRVAVRVVTEAEAEILTGLARPVCLDRLKELLMDGSADKEGLENYVKPAPQNSPAEAANDRLAHARAKVAEWDRKIAKAETHRAKWARRVKRLEKRVTLGKEGVRR